MTKMQTARVIFEEQKVRTLADCDDIPSDAAMAGREFRYETRCDEALERLFTVIGRRMVPVKPPKDGRALERTAEDIYSAVGAAMRSAPSGAAQRPLLQLRALTPTSWIGSQRKRRGSKSPGARCHRTWQSGSTRTGLLSTKPGRIRRETRR